MATNFPTSLDSPTNPITSNTLNSPSHSGQHSDSNDAIKALEAKVGVDGSAVTTSLDYKVAQKSPLRPVNTKVTLVDADEITGNDSAASFGQIKTTWANIKAFLKTYFDTLYQPLATVLTNTTASYTSALDTKLGGIATSATANAKISGATLDSLTDDTGFVTAKAVQDGHNVPHAAPGTSGNILQSNGTDWSSVANPSLPLGGGTMTGKVVNAGRDEVGKTYTPASGSQTVALDCSVNNVHIVSGHASGTAITFTIANATNNQPFIVSVLQGGTTVSTITGWFATVRWAGGTAPTLTATLNKRDTFGFIRTGANTYDGFIIGQNA